VGGEEAPLSAVIERGKGGEGPAPGAGHGGDTAVHAGEIRPAAPPKAHPGLAEEEKREPRAREDSRGRLPGRSELRSGDEIAVREEEAHGGASTCPSTHRPVKV